jgi:iron complex transport system permease protein
MAATSGPNVPRPTFPSRPSGTDLSVPADASTTPAAEAGLGPRAPGATSRVTATTPAERPARQRAGLHRFGRTALVLGGLVATLAVAMLVSLVVAGPTGVPIPPGTIAALTLNWIPFLHVPHVWSDTQATIVLQVRLPRTLTAVLAGAALATAGTTFQGIFRNPLADPAVVGVSSGAALGAIMAMLFPLDLAYVGFSLVSLAAFAGALLAVVAVYALARAGGRLPVTTLLLAGFAVSAALSAVTTLVMSLSAGGRLEGMFVWLLGGLGNSTPDQLAVAAALVGAGMLPLWALGRELNALALGDEGAMHLGLNPAHIRLLFIACGTLIAAVAVALCGIIGFVGLVVPHMARLLFGPDNRVLLPAATVLGGVFLTGVDAIARAASPVTLPIGVITALIGAPLFLLLLRRRSAYAF